MITGLAAGGRVGCAGMSPRPLWQYQHSHNDEHRDHRRCDRPAECKAPIVHGLVEQIADRGTERAGVRMKAAQNRRTFETLDQKYNPAITARPAVKTNAPPP